MRIYVFDCFLIVCTCSVVMNYGNRRLDRRVIMKTMIITTCLLVCSQTMANVSCWDDFNDNSVDPSWTLFFADPGAFLTETNQHLEYTCPGGGEKYIGWQWTGNILSATQDWSVAIDMSHLYDSSLSGSQEFEFNLEVSNATNGIAIKYGNYAGSFVMRTEEFDIVTDQVIYSVGTAVSVSQATVRISFDVDLETMTTAYSTGGGFTTLTNLSVSSWDLN